MEGFSVLLLAFVPCLKAAEKLDTFTIDKSEISVSGISSGAAMAVQFQMAYSASVKGVGSIAGVPYHCSEGNITMALGPCMSSPLGLDVSRLVSDTRTAANKGDIDPIDDFKHSRVFIWSGVDDAVVKTDVSRKMETFYKTFLSPTHIKAVYATGAVHTFPTENYGNPCSTFGSPYIGKCNYNGAYELLNFIHGNLRRPSSSDTLKGKFIEFDQTDFLPKPTKKRFFIGDFLKAEQKAFAAMGMFMGSAFAAEAKVAASMLGAFSHGGHHILHPTTNSPGMDDVGYAYIPSGCFDSTVVCKLHVAFHGCKMQREVIGDVFARHAGYNEVGELNDIIILYPQIKADNSTNPNGCWDWWAYTGDNYDTKDGLQMKMTKSMIDRLTGDNPSTS